jgi:hypothetical protein
MGATACSLIPKIELDKDHGYPIWVEDSDEGSREFLGGWEGWVVPMYHPAAGLHDTGMMIPLLDDFERLGKWLRGKWWPPKPDEGLVLDYKVVEEKDEITEDLILPDTPYEYLPADTENDSNRPWSLQYSIRPGHGRLIRANRKDLIGHFRECIEGWQGLELHHAAHDLEVLESMGIRGVGFSDTMQAAYQIGNLPQGLKALAWRLLGVRMRSWEDVVLPHSRFRMIDWLITEWNESMDKRERVEIQLKTKLKISYRVLKEEKDLKRILSHSHKPDYDLWEKVNEAGLAKEGMPRVSIANVPAEEAMFYACQDADLTGRLGTALKGIREGLTGEKNVVGGDWQVGEEDWDQ